MKYVTSKGQKKYQFILQKKIGLLFIIAGVIVCAANLLYLSGVHGWLEALKDPSVYLLAILTVCSLIWALVNAKIVRIFQVLFIFISAAIAILETHDSIYGIGLIFLAIILAFKYGFFEKRALLKLSLTGVCTFFLLELSIVLGVTDGRIIVAFDAMAFLSLMVIFIYILYKSEILDYLQRQKQSSSDINRLRSERDRLRERLRVDKKKLVHLDERISRLEEEQKPINLADYGISPAEERIIHILCLYRCENREIAARLHLSVPTIKTHLRHIMDKLGVEDRFAIIDMCRNNFRRADR